jgi:hypothetical protein
VSRDQRVAVNALAGFALREGGRLEKPGNNQRGTAATEAWQR